MLYAKVIKIGCTLAQSGPFLFIKHLNAVCSKHYVLLCQSDCCVSLCT